MSTRQIMRRTSRFPVALSLVAATAALGLAGCRDLMLADEAAVELSDPVKRHPVAFATQPEVLMVEVGPNGQGLSPNQQADVLRFVSHYKSESTGSLKLASPRGAGAHLAVSNAARQLEGIVRGAGVDASQVEVSRYAVGSSTAPALRLSYDRLLAVPPQCADWATDLGENRERLHYNNFGCATQRNFALNVANARDIMEPQGESPRSSERRSTVWSSYVTAGSIPGSQDMGSSSSSTTPTPAVQ